ncbi:hypothetical protein NH340_JMT03277 [Sarcoptes scabiei]|nr:hypothetical protein NH340_JMT03277 [Sarcoptes scabiei]
MDNNPIFSMHCHRLISSMLALEFNFFCYRNLFWILIIFQTIFSNQWSSIEMCKTTAIVYRKVPHTIIKKVPVIKEVIKTIKVPVYVERHHHHRHRLDDKISYPIAKIYDPHPPHQGHQQQVHHILSDRYQSKFDKIHHNQIPMANKNYLDDNELGEFDRGFR